MYDEWYVGEGMIVVTNEDGESYWGEGFDPNEDPAIAEEKLRQQMDEMEQVKKDIARMGE